MLCEVSSFAKLCLATPLIINSFIRHPAQFISIFMHNVEDVEIDELCQTEGCSAYPETLKINQVILGSLQSVLFMRWE